MRKKIRVLVIDDSPVFRRLIEKGLTLNDKIQVVATACDAYDAKEKIEQYEPDVITCDVEMPGMNGIEFVKRVFPQYPVPIIMVSSLTNTVFDAMKAGAIDFVGKPDISSSDSVEKFIYELIGKVISSSSQRVQVDKVLNNPSIGVINNVNNSGEKEPCMDTKYKIVAIGSSTGGTEALTQLITALPSNMPGIVVVQHIPPKFSKMFAERLNTLTSLNVKEAETGDYVEPGYVYIAPGDKHMRVIKMGSKYKIECFVGERVSGHCPSVDVLFESVAKGVGDKAVGIILTGMGADGAKGLASMRRKGAYTIGQDEKSCVVYGMPRVAYEIGAVVKQLPLNKIPSHLVQTLK